MELARDIEDFRGKGGVGKVFWKGGRGEGGKDKTEGSFVDTEVEYMVRALWFQKAMYVLYNTCKFTVLFYVQTFFFVGRGRDLQ